MSKIAFHTAGLVVGTTLAAALTGCTSTGSKQREAQPEPPDARSPATVVQENPGDDVNHRDDEDARRNERNDQAIGRQR